MILYCDTSALVKLYVHEEGSEALKRAADAATAIAACRITYAEAMAGLARRGREQPIDAGALEKAKARLIADWPNYLIVEIDQALVESAGELSDVFALRGYDSVQLASAQVLNRHLPGEIRFACFDSRLDKAARALGIAGPFAGP